MPKNSIAKKSKKNLPTVAYIYLHLIKYLQWSIFFIETSNYFRIVGRVKKINCSQMDFGSQHQTQQMSPFLPKPTVETYSVQI